MLCMVMSSKWLNGDEATRMRIRYGCEVVMDGTHILGNLTEQIKRLPQDLEEHVIELEAMRAFTHYLGDVLPQAGSLMVVMQLHPNDVNASIDYTKESAFELMTEHTGWTLSKKVARVILVDKLGETQVFHSASKLN